MPPSQHEGQQRPLSPSLPPSGGTIQMTAAVSPDDRRDYNKAINKPVNQPTNHSTNQPQRPLSSPSYPHRPGPPRTATSLPPIIISLLLSKIRGDARLVAYAPYDAEVN